MSAGMESGLRVLVVNNNGESERTREMLNTARIPIGCIMPVMPEVKKVLRNMDVSVHAGFAQYDVVLIEPIDRDLAEQIACSAIDKVPWQKVIVIGKGPLTDSKYSVVFAPNMLGAVAELRRMRLI